ncbi:hypothetical protein ACOI1C_00235 [Bacillus sp. DJP31]|uniref:hypothetical protein n=1 Tax=Bacillus sp. DJP31 TaxID=3409789 RepID=UPI003BB761F7
MIVDDGFEGEESVTTEFTSGNKKYSITFNKQDLELKNAWYFKDDTSIPANLPDHIIESIRNDVKERI